MAHTGYTVQMLTRDVEIVLYNGAILKGQIFVSEYSRLHAGSEMISEFFENESQFFPVRVNNDIIILSKGSVLLVTYPVEEDYSIYNIAVAEFFLSNGKSLTAEVPIQAQTPHPRLSDQINLPERFLVTLTEARQKITLINKTHITYLMEKK
jgi:hypothetical protein